MVSFCNPIMHNPYNFITSYLNQIISIINNCKSFGFNSKEFIVLVLRL